MIPAAQGAVQPAKRPSAGRLGGAPDALDEESCLSPPHSGRPRPGPLWRDARRIARDALAHGALHPIASRARHLRADGVDFRVYELADRAPKRLAKRAQRASGANPFLPPDPALLVSDIGPRHRCVLNKFPVIAPHLLIVTRRFEPQQSWLSRADFAALTRCLADGDALAFYNSGPVAGASQPHKHLQLIPLPQGRGSLRFPFEARLAAGALPYRCAARRIARPGAAAYARAYRSAALELGLGDPAQPGTPPPHNLLATRDWLWLVPRRRHRVRGISFNALAFAGLLLVRNREQFETLRGIGPSEALRRAGRGSKQNQARSR